MENKKKSQRTLILVMIINFLISIIKICLGLYTKSTSMTADGFHSISDTSSNIVGIIGLHYASKPKDKSTLTAITSLKPLLPCLYPSCSLP